LLSAIINKVITPADNRELPVGKGKQQLITASGEYGFTMQVDNVSVNLKECRFNIKLFNTSLIGFMSNGSPRISTGNVVNQNVSLPFAGEGSFVIGGLNKKEVVESSTGIPWLSDIPYLGYLFSSKSKSLKNSELVVVASCSWGAPDEVAK
jgi:Flp pilus assembly secretin CpaC